MADKIVTIAKDSAISRILCMWIPVWRAPTLYHDDSRATIPALCFMSSPPKQIWCIATEDMMDDELLAKCAYR